MTSTVHPDVLDSALSVLSGNSDLIVALASEPSVYGDATGAAKLSQASLSTSDFTLQGTTSGRELAIAAKSSTADATGSATYIALLDTTTSRILFSASIPSVSLSSGDVVQFLAWSIALAPSA